jgi:hypothetical protein
MKRMLPMALLLALMPVAAAGAEKVYRPDMSRCAGFTAADAGEILQLPAAALTVKTEKLGDSLWSCVFRGKGNSLAFSVEVHATAGLAAAEMERYRENLELAAETPPFRDKLANGAWSDISPLGDEAVWTDVNATLTVRLGNLTLQVQAPGDKRQQIRVARVFLKRL